MALDTTIRKLLDRGIPLAALDAIVATGVARSQPFTMAQAEGEAEPNVAYDVNIPSGALTAISFQLQRSTDFGASWQNVGAAIDGVANPSGSLPAVTQGSWHRLNVTALTLGTAPSVTVNITT